MSAVPRHIPPLSGVGAGFLFYDPRPVPPSMWRRLAEAALRNLRDVAYRFALSLVLLVGLEVAYVIRAAQ